MTRRFFYDCEFMEEPGFLELISIGVVDESGERQFYACNLDADFTRANDWVEQNVLPLLPCKNGDGGFDPNWKKMDDIRKNLLAFLEPSEEDPVELWGYYSAYDHVMLCWIFGRMIDLPKGMPMHTMDIQQEMVIAGIPKSVLPPDTEGVHDALVDAEWNRRAWMTVRDVVGLKRDSTFVTVNSNTRPFVYIEVMDLTLLEVDKYLKSWGKRIIEAGVFGNCMEPVFLPMRRGKKDMEFLFIKEDMKGNEEVIDGDPKKVNVGDVGSKGDEGSFSLVIEEARKVARDLRQEIAELRGAESSLRASLDMERHEFNRKQVGMSHLVTILMDARFEEGERIYLEREQFVRLGSEAAALRVDNDRLGHKLECLRNEKILDEAHKLSHKMALQESTGCKIADLVAERDSLRALLDETRAPSYTTDSPDDGIGDMGSRGDPLTWACDISKVDGKELEDCRRRDVPPVNEIDAEYRARTHREMDRSEKLIEETLDVDSKKS